MTYDPLALGQDRSVPSSVYLPLLELGAVSLKSCTNSSTKQQCFLAASEFARKFGKIVKARHKIALNRLTLFLSQDRSVSDPMQVKSTPDLTRNQRILDPAYATTQRSFSPDSKEQKLMWEWAHQATDCERNQTASSQAQDFGGQDLSTRHTE